MGGFLDSLQFQAPGGPGEAVLLAVSLAVIAVAFRRHAGRGVAALVWAGALGSFIQTGHPAIPAAIAVTGIALALRHGPRPHRTAAFGRELALVLGGFTLYELGRFAVVSSEPRAVSNAERVIELERSTGTFFEPRLQELLTSSDLAIRVLNLCYSHGFLAFVAATILWFYFTDPPRYRLYRNALGISTALAVGVIALFPVAPPRLFPGLDIADTVVTFGATHAFANEFAAIPSLHVGWFALAGFVAGLPQEGWRRWLVTATPGLAMLLTVIATGNHYWIDGLVGCALTLGPALELRYGFLRSGLQRMRSAWAEMPARGRTKVRFNVLSLGGMFVYLAVAQFLQPGFTAFWGYLFFQVGATLALLLGGEFAFARHGGLSWATHSIAVVCSFADVFGTDGNLYARIDEYDKLTHFLGTGAFAAGAYDILRAWSLRTGRPWKSEERLYLSMAIAIAVGVGWEVYEYLGDEVFHTTRAQGRWDTLNDVISDSLGALTLGVLLWLQERSAGEVLAGDAAPATTGPETPPPG